MENDEAENQNESAHAQPAYPEPGRASYSPYPTIPSRAQPVISQSIGETVREGPTTRSSSLRSLRSSSATGSRSYGPWPGSAQSTHSLLNTEHLSRLPDNATDIRSSSGSRPEQTTDLSHHMPAQTSTSVSSTYSDPLTEAQRLAQQFHNRHGNPELGSGADDLTVAQGRGVEIRSTLAGLYQDDIGGKAAARRAWEAAHAYVAQHKWDAEQEGARDPDLDSIFAEVDDVPSSSPARSQRRQRGRGGWRKLLKGTEHEDVGRSKTPGRGRGAPRGKRGPRRGRGKLVDPGREFKNFLAEANRAYLAGDYTEAADQARQAVQANPEVHQAHALLATILEQMGRHLEAAQSMKVGAHTARNPEVWMQVADKILKLASDAGENNDLLREATECYSEALKLTTALKHNPEMELEIRSRALTVFEQLNDARNCRMHCRHILKDFPEKTEFVQRYAILCARWQDSTELLKARECYERAFEIYKDHEHFGDEEDQTDKWSHLNIYLEIHDMTGKPVDGIVACKRLARWFLGRKEETFWDRYALDDREFDNDNSRRRYVGEFQQGRASMDLSTYGDGLPIDLRVRLGLFRMKMGPEYHDEAMRHFKPLLQYADEVDDYDDMFLMVGNTLRDSGKIEEAVKYYDIARTRTDADDPNHGLGEMAWMQLASCYQIVGRIEDAVSSYENVRSRKGQIYTRASARLARLYEDIGETDKARFLCDELITLNRRDLLYEAQVKMIPLLSKSKNPPGSAPPMAVPRAPPSQLPSPLPSKPLQMKPLPQPRRMDGLSTFGNEEQNHSTTEMTSLGPVSQPVIMPPMPPESFESMKKKRPRGKKRGILSNISGDLDESTAIDDGESALARPRLKRKYTRKSDAAEEQDRSRRLLDAQTRTNENYGMVSAFWPAIYEGTDLEAIEQWTEAAHSMLDEFKAMKVFFPDRDQNIKLRATDNGTKPFLRDFSGKGVEHEGPKQFLGIAFREWQRVFIDLALLYVKTGEQDRCYKVVQEVLCSANVFYLDPELNQISYGAAIHVGLAFNDSQYLIQLARQVIASKPTEYRNSEGYQLFAAVARFSYGSNWFVSGPTQKFMLRMVKQSDFMAMTDEVRKKVDWSAQGPGLAQRAQNYPKEDVADAHILTMYGHMVAAANHSFSAMPYYYRALALQPDNICINLSIATMWIQYSMKRQVQNRQEGITNGLSFLYRYYALRTATGDIGHRQEAEYNVARMWHYLGLTHLAVPAYEKVLALSDSVQAEKANGDVPLEFDVEDYAPEAAYALQNLYGLVGNDEAARDVTEKWLVI